MLQTTIGGRYKIVKQIGYGGFGQTYLAQDLLLPDQDWCVVKKLQPQSTDDFVLQTARRLFEAEAKVLNKLGKHECIPTLLAHFAEQAEFYLVQEFIDGESIEQELHSGKLSAVGAVVDFLLDILPTLDFVHKQGVIHRDIKPANLIRRRQDQRIVLIDFGAVKQIYTQIAQTAPSRLTVAVGTEGYMPNEQANGKPKPCSDIYAVGMIAIQALTNIPPNQLPENPETGEVNWHDYTTVSEQLQCILDKMVRCDFRQRYQSAEEVLRDLQELRSAQASTQVMEVSAPTLVVSPAPSSETKVSNPVIAGKNRSVIGWLLGLFAVIAAVSMVVVLGFTARREVKTEEKVEPIPNVDQVANVPITKGSGRKYAFVSARALTTADLLGKTNLELDLMLNEVFASHGRRFEDAELQNYFSLQSWYIPRYSPKDFPSNLLSDVETANVALIANFKKQRTEQRQKSPDRCLLGVRIVADLQAPLNVRSRPSVNAEIVAKLDNDTRVSVLKEEKGWLQIDQPVPGWIAANRTEPICQD
jgi:serine/threonine protein kinase